MKVYEIVGRQQLDEINLKHAAAAGIVGASMMGLANKAIAPDHPKVQPPPIVQPAKAEPAKPQLSDKEQAVVNQIAKRYDADPDFVTQVILLAKKYEKPRFPTAHDLLAIIAVESEFDPDAVSGLRKDPAVGLMQVRPGEWGLDPEALRDPETAIRVGSDILHKYYRHLHGDKEAAIQAYNVGLTNYQQGGENPNYLMKVTQRLKNILPIT